MSHTLHNAATGIEVKPGDVLVSKSNAAWTFQRIHTFPKDESGAGAMLSLRDKSGRKMTVAAASFDVTWRYVEEATPAQTYTEGTIVRVKHSATWTDHVGVVLEAPTGGIVRVGKLVSPRGIHYGGPFRFWHEDIEPYAGIWTPEQCATLARIACTSDDPTNPSRGPSAFSPGTRRAPIDASDSKAF